MGAHTIATREAARERTELVRDALAAAHSASDQETATWFWLNELNDLLERGHTSGTLRAWMERHHDEPVDTLQVTLRLDEQGQASIVDSWAPGSRRVDASRATRVLLNGSTREYAGVTTYLVTDRAYVGFAKWGESSLHMLVYVR